MSPNSELKAIFAADQADRQAEPPPDIWERDAVRRRRVEELLDAGALHSAEDYLHAAFIFQHGDRLEHYWQAHELAMQAVELGHPAPARWLAAASYDRWLMHQGLPQKFGTQYRRDGGSWRLYEYDPATTDAERARWDVPTLGEALAYAVKLNGEPAPPRPAPAAQAHGHRLGSASLADLSVEVVEIDRTLAGGLAGGMPDPEPLDPADIDIIIPGYLPPGLEPRRLGEGCCAVDARGAIVLTWFELLLPPGEPLVLAWNSAEGPAPALLTIELGDRAAILATAAWSAVSAERPPIIVARASLDTCWLVGGHLPHAELIGVLASLLGGG